MENQVLDLEQTLNKLMGSLEDTDEVMRILKQISENRTEMNKSLNYQSNLLNIQQTNMEDFKLSPVIIRDANSTSIFGPASVYNESLLMANNNPHRKNYRSTQPMKHIPDENLNTFFDFKQSDLQPPSELKTAVSLFFRLQYPSISVFIHRESFLYFFLNNDYDNDFVSEELVYAISALGLRMSEDDQSRMKADKYYDNAKAMVFQLDSTSISTDESSITKIQTLLCLAIYDIGRGKLTSGWLLSGLAFRMGFDFGFELDPKEWQLSHLHSDEQYSRNKELNSKFPFHIHKVKSRIYWGCYIADHFISLVLGRPTTLKLSDTNMPASENMPELANIDEFVYLNPKTKSVDSAYPGLKALVELINLTDYMLPSVFEPLANSQQELLNLEYSKRLEKVYSYNAKILKWKANLPQKLQWTHKDLKESCNTLVLQTPICYYYIVLLCLNRPFIQLAAIKPKEYELYPYVICDNIVREIEIMIASFKTTNEENNRAINIFFVYCIIMSISVLYISFSILKEKDEKLKIEATLVLFSQFLDHCSTIWRVAEKPSEVTKQRIKNLWNDSAPDKDHLNQDNSETQTGKSDPFMNIMDNLFNPNGIEAGQSLLRYDLASMDWDNLFNLDLDFQGTGFPGL